MKLVTYNEILEISHRIRHDVLRRYSVGESLPSERALSSELGETHNRVHRALEMLVEDGVICSSGCRRGYYLRSRSTCDRGHDCLRARRELVFFLPLSPETFQAKRWQRVCEQFRMINPDLEMRFVFGHPGDLPEADIYLCWVPLLDCSCYRPLDQHELLGDGVTEADFLPGMDRIGVCDGLRYGVPILQMPAVFWTHRNLSHRCGLVPDDFREPLDFFRWGTKMEDSAMCAMGFYFYGFTYHAMNWGLSCRHRQGMLCFSQEKLRRFLSDIKPWIKAQNISYSPFNYTNFFHRGQLGMYAGYLSALSLKEHRFQLLGQPLLPGGFACHTAFLLALGKGSRQADWGMEFIRFVLSPHIQRQFFDQEATFSVLRDVYAEEFEELNGMCGGRIPPYDFRGFAPQLDLAYHGAGRFLYQECANYLCGYTTLEQAVERMSCFNPRHLT